MKNIEIRYETVSVCPLCGKNGLDRYRLSRSRYFFGQFSIPLPDRGVILRECCNCSLLFKSAVPNREDLAFVMSEGATDVWRSKSGVHPALTWILPHLPRPANNILDIGASNGDLLVQLKSYVKYLSALDVVAYPQCREIINKEYIISDVEATLAWSGEKYEVVTAFDVFEHFIAADAALQNINNLVSKGGKLIVETGDWLFNEENIGEWYYVNLFEHQIFWTQKTFTYLCGKYGFELLTYQLVAHKNRRKLSYIKRILMELVVIFSKFPVFQKIMLTAGKGDPLRFAKPALKDHAFVVLGKTNA